MLCGGFRVRITISSDNVRSRTLMIPICITYSLSTIDHICRVATFEMPPRMGSSGANIHFIKGHSETF